MPKSSGKRQVRFAPPQANEKPDMKERLRQRKSVQEQQLDDRRAYLIEQILNLSTKLSVDESTSPPSARQAAQDHAPLLELLDELRSIESTLNPKLPSRDEKSWTDFFAWVDTRVDTGAESDQKVDLKAPLSSRIGVSVAQKSVSSPSTPAGSDEYSLITKVPIKSGEKVFAISRGSMLTTETATRDVELDDFIKNDIIASEMQNVVLVLHLLNEYSKGERSNWWPYLSILPQKLLPILRLNKQKLNQHLLASAHIFEALKMLRAIARQYTYFYKRLEATKLPLKHDFTFLYYAWGVSIVCSRQNEIPPRKAARIRDHQQQQQQQQRSMPVVHALIPLLDMCNHELKSNQAIFSDDASCLTAPHDLEVGQEVTINYGCRTSGDFYIHNGFVPDQVPADAVPLTIALSKDNLLASKTKLLKLLNMPTAMGRFKLIANTQANRHKRDPHLTMFLIIYCLDERELELIMSSANLVAVADYVYDHIQYKMDEQPNGAAATNGDTSNGQGADDEMGVQIDKMKLRLANCYKDYLARRSSVCVALIDRALEELNSPDKDNGGQLEDDKLHAIRLLQREREIHGTYVNRVG